VKSRGVDHGGWVARALQNSIWVGPSFITLYFAIKTADQDAWIYDKAWNYTPLLIFGLISDTPVVQNRPNVEIVVTKCVLLTEIEKN